MAIDRKKGHLQERDHAHRHESDFRVAARRNRLLGAWAAERLGIDGEAAEAYAKEVVAADLEEPGDEDVIRKILGDFESRGVALARDELLETMAAMVVEARRQLAQS